MNPPLSTRTACSLLCACALASLAGCGLRVTDLHALGDAATGDDTFAPRFDSGAPRDAGGGMDSGEPTPDAPPTTDVPTVDDTSAADSSDVVVDSGPPDTGPIPCGGGCGDNAHCVDGSCQCDPFFARMGSACVATMPADPAARSDADVCAQWTEGHRETSAVPYVASASMCDPGSMPRDAINDTLRRINMYRWLVGLGPVTDDDALDANDQQCALMETLKGWPGASNPTPHMPTSDWACYTAAGAGAAGSSNIAWGIHSGPDAVEVWIADSGNETTLGHRRWLLHPPLGPIGIGVQGDASCAGIFGASGGGTSGPWWSYPPPGPTPAATAAGYWTFHTSAYGIGGATVTVQRTSDGMNMPIQMLSLSSGFGDETLGWSAMGWSASSGESYHVTVSGLSGPPGGSVGYDVRLIDCP